ncbi:uncharacterized protein LOC108653339 isoform X2 [Drosophila navojoa]|uniref:uncharacterized protein LOC108653339 isoform X2 n=1 Tax=Drosophila navojoa TaxID=7232 RepID=UPI0011BF5F5B|nr:uncharacterized protein LOC108653339 isoform X2 [Drosophila navojoa]
MLLQCFNQRQCISLFLLLMTASPMQMMAIDGSSKEALASSWSSSSISGRDDSDDSSWPANKFYGNGNLLPNIEAREMVPEFVDTALNFPPYPLNKNRHWRPDRYLKQLALVHRTWLQSPAKRSRTKLKRGLRTYRPTMKLNDYVLQPDVANYYYERKREPSSRFKPSISAVMTNLGDFFKQLKANVHYAEQTQHQLGEEESQLLEGVHPHQQMIIDDDDDDDDNDAGALGGADYDSGQPSDRKGSKLRSYRPSQKIRSLVSRNPNGYRGSQFIDPSYMWLGLGK